MGVFLGTHDFGEALTQEQMDDSWKRYSASCEKHVAKALKVFYNLEAGRTWCITEAESADVVNAAHDAENLPTKEVFEVQKLK